jgi:hypothetical protein
MASKAEELKLSGVAIRHVTCMIQVPSPELVGRPHALRLTWVAVWRIEEDIRRGETVQNIVRPASDIAVAISVRTEEQVIPRAIVELSDSAPVRPITMSLALIVCVLSPSNPYNWGGAIMVLISDTRRKNLRTASLDRDPVGVLRQKRAI